jgi:hypothetical protein
LKLAQNQINSNTFHNSGLYNLYICMYKEYDNPGHRHLVDQWSLYFYFRPLCIYNNIGVFRSVFEKENLKTFFFLFFFFQFQNYCFNRTIQYILTFSQIRSTVRPKDCVIVNPLFNEFFMQINSDNPFTSTVYIYP